MNIKLHRRVCYWLALIIITTLGISPLQAQTQRSQKSYIQGGMLIKPDTTTLKTGGGDTSLIIEGDSLSVDSLKVDSLIVDSLQMDSLRREAPLGDSLVLDSLSSKTSTRRDSLDAKPRPLALKDNTKLGPDGEPKIRKPLFSDSMSISKMGWISAALPGYGLIYNKDYWKLPIGYSALGGSIALYLNENKTYKPLKSEFDEMLTQSMFRSDELDDLQAEMIRSNTRRQLYLGAAIGSYVYMLTDAVINYSTNDVSDVKKATTLAMVCPGAGQIYNGSYWKLPFVVGGFASVIYTIDWNNRGYTRFKTAYALKSAYDTDPDSYPNGSPDEFNGKYQASLLQSYRDSYRRNRDLCIIFAVGVYILQIVDAHVDAHLKDFDVSNDLTMDISPLINSSSSYLASQSGSSSGVYGFSLNINF